MTMSSPAAANAGGQGTILIAAGRVITPQQVLTPGWVEVGGDRIVHLGAGVPPRAPDIDSPRSTVVPGFVDTHTHGGGGASFSTTDPREVVQAVETHRTRGTTTMLASLVTAPIAALTRQVAALAELVQDGTLGGIHLEGPWLSPAYKGAHDSRHLTKPESSAVDALFGIGRGTIRMVTIAPEVEGAMEAIRQVVGLGAVAAIGHTGADYDLTKVAIDAGATVATHLFNGMPPLHHREPGPVLALLEDPRVTVEVIADGVHLHPQVARFAMLHAAGGFSLVTDAMAAAGGADGQYRLGGREVRVSGGRATLAGTDTIAGSTVTMHQAFQNVVAAGLPLLDAVEAASATPASRLGLSDVGRLETGFRADLLLLDERLELQGVMRGGVWR